MSFSDRIEGARVLGSDLSKYTISLDEWNNALEEMRLRLQEAWLRYRGWEKKREVGNALATARMVLPAIGVFWPRASLRLRVNVEGVDDEDDDCSYSLAEFIRNTAPPMEGNDAVLFLQPPFRSSSGTHGSEERNCAWQSCCTLAAKDTFWKVDLIGSYLEISSHLVTEVRFPRLKEIAIVESDFLWREYLRDRWSCCRPLNGAVSPEARVEVEGAIRALCRME